MLVQCVSKMCRNYAIVLGKPSGFVAMVHCTLAGWRANSVYPPDPHKNIVLKYKNIIKKDVGKLKFINACVL